ncbi:MAG: hypothetical protein K2G62_03890, partial [Oscillospiraceae bacterium]|nr:hypothetical protein [Oscillospiraceae bacterium]
MLNIFDVIVSAALLNSLAKFFILPPMLPNADLIFDVTFCTPEPNLVIPVKAEFMPLPILDKPDFIL